MPLDFEPLHRCVQTLERSLTGLAGAKEKSLDYEVYRNSVVKSFEMALEMCGRSLKRALKEYVGDPKQIDNLTFKNVIREAAKVGLITDATPWFTYRDSRNTTVHDYGEDFAETVLKLVKQFVIDARTLHETLVSRHGHSVG
jgi:nucleotidyltransferase substrate binding protein (TIGR01987 family)